ncbi:GSCFA domain-containing protein [Maribacter dokdonensis]|uniref:GSCFA domain-containing protein n=1 Tax=Maribacter dokdonensis TaxID=320912 RepID=UPI0027354E01|nr:GSCFA domain-containing protein [Maribacter dokdonensis]MDP2526433.1 GSCFA domain-containing protein [Maribacter dokdonensis]
MNLLTEIPLSKANNPIDYSSQLLLLGSCFSENIGAKLSYYKFQGIQNPFGILFHSLAIERLIEKSVNQEFFTEEDVFNENEQWHSFDAHSSLSNPSKAQIIEDLNNAISRTSTQVNTASHIIITLGTAWVYRKTSSNKVVANCHKVPQSNFTKELLSVEEVAKSLKQVITFVQSVNPTVQFIFTVSPVRHLKDGFLENQRSKSHLIAAIHQVLNEDRVSYFPSYELMMDELRDYRFYAKDMIHPNETAIEYIWEKFVEVWLASNTSSTMKKIEKVQKGMLHKPFNENSDQHQKFLVKLNVLKSEIQTEFPHLQF